MVLACKNAWKIRVFLFIALSFFVNKGFSQGIFKIFSEPVKKPEPAIPRYNTIEQMRALAELNEIKTLSEEGSDILFFANVIIKKHLDFDRLVDFMAFCDECTNAIMRLDELAISNASQEDRLSALYYELCRLSAMLHDQHTFVRAPQAVIDNYQVYPINLTMIEKKLVITAIASMYDNYLGEEVIEINGFTIEQIHKAMKSIISSSTEVYSIRQADFQLNIKQSLEAAGICSSDGMLKIKLSSGHNLMFEAVSYQDFKALYYNVLRQTVPKTINTNTWYEGWDISNNCLFVKYNVAENDKNYKVSQFVQDLFYAYDANSFTTMIIDLRSNQGGGDSELLDDFIKKIGKYIASGKCSAYVLIGPDTFSYAIQNVLDLKKVGCMLIGTPTGGAINYYGSIRTFELPNSHIVAGCATRYHFKDKNSLYKSVVPDVFVDFSVDDYIIGNDPQVEWVLKNAQATTNY